MELTEIQLNDIKKIKDAYKRGYFVKGSEVTALYNAVFNKNLNSTNCSSCIKNRANELINAYNKYIEQKQIAEQSSTAQATENNLPSVEEQPKRKVGRPKKTQD